MGWGCVLPTRNKQIIQNLLYGGALENRLICTKLSIQSGGTMKIGEFQRWVFQSLVPQLYQQECH